MEFSWKEQTFDFTKIQVAQVELAELGTRIVETQTTLTSLKEEVQKYNQQLVSFTEKVKEKELELILLNSQLTQTKKEIFEHDAQLAHIQAEVEKHKPVLVKIAEDKVTAQKLEEEIKNKTHTLKIQTKHEDETYKRIAELEKKLKERETVVNEIDGKVAHNTKILRTITWEREQNESLKNEITQKLATLQVDQKNMSQYIRPIQKKLDKAGIKLDFLKFIQDI